jgi:hypothetical protein
LRAEAAARQRERAATSRGRGSSGAKSAGCAEKAPLDAASAAPPAVHRGEQLALVHPRATADVEAFRVVVELIPGPPAGPASGSPAAALTGGQVANRGPGALSGLAAARAFLLDRPGRDLLGSPLGATLLLLAPLYVLVLT